MKKWFHPRPILRALLSMALCLAALVWFHTSLSSLQRGQGEEGRQQLEDALRRAAVACYSVEGTYPPNLSYLEDHYGIQIDEDRYSVFYNIFAENLMPDITVLEQNT